MKRLRVLVAEDSVTVRERLREILEAADGIEIVGVARDGREAIELCARLRPDVVTLDMMMPVMTGVAATEYIMAHCPTPILIVSSSTNRGELFRTYDALAAGAVDVLEKPKGLDDENWDERFVKAVRMVARVRVITHVRGRLGLLGTASAAGVAPDAAGASRDGPPPPKAPVRVVAIGASTGGPSAILDILRAMPAPFPVPVLFVLHIGGPFGSAFAEWLDAQTSHRVSFAVEGQALHSLAGRVVMAPPERHLAVRAGRLVLTDDAERHSCRPSVDVLFESLAASEGAGAAGCLLTGMGRDGASGLLAMRRAGARTIAQDEQSSVVYGMPREAIELGAAVRVLPLDQIGPALTRLALGDERT